MVLSIVEPPNVIVHEVRDSLLRHGELSGPNAGRDEEAGRTNSGTLHVLVVWLPPRTKASGAIRLVLSSPPFSRFQ